MIEDVLYGRPAAMLKVFISSEMRSLRLQKERSEAARAVEATGWHFAWYWERDAQAGPYSSEDLCVKQARSSDRLVLILGQDLTPITKREYREAAAAGVACFIFVHAGVTRSAEAEAFLTRERPRSVYKTFGSPAELRTVLTEALIQHSILEARQALLHRRAIVAAPRLSQSGGST